MLFIALAFMSVLLVSCTPEPQMQLSDFTAVGAVGEEGVVEFIVRPTNPEATYIVGLVDEVNMMDMGGKDGVREYIMESLASGYSGAVYSDMTVHTYPGLTKYVNWYLYVAQVHDGQMVGDVVYSNATRIYSPYLEYKYPSAWATPMAVSANGLWVVGAANGNNAFLYDVVAECGENLVGGSLSDVTNDGVCYGQDIDMQKPVKYENGKFSYLTLPDNRMGDAMAVTSDGSKVYGWCSSPGRIFMPYVIENGEFRELSVEGSHGVSYIMEGSDRVVETDIVAARVGTCADNGAAAGYGLDSGPMLEQGVIWKADGTFKVIGEGRMLYDENSYTCDQLYGGYHTAISPDGKYAASTVGRFNGGFELVDSYPYLYDIEADQVIFPSEDDRMDMGGLSVCCVANDGSIYLTDGGSPYIWRQDTGVMNLQLYMESIYGSFSPKMEGRLVDVSADGKTFVLCQSIEDPEEGACILTRIYIF